MKFSVGDAVSFVNEKLEGTVSKLLPENCYRIEIEDGFTLDVTAAEIVLRQTFLKSAPLPAPLPSAPKEIAKTDAGAVVSVFSALEGFYLLVIPEHAQVVRGSVQWWLFNGTSTEQLYAAALTLGKGKEQLLAHGILPAGTAVLLTEFRRENSLLQDELILRWISCHPGSEKPPSFSVKTIHPEWPVLEQTNAKLPSPFCFTRYHLLDTVLSIVQDTVDLKELAEKYKSSSTQSKQKENPVSGGKKKSETLSQFGLNPGIHEMDLHIEELIENPDKISAAEMLEIQLAAFRKALDRALISRNREITFIHGIGNGKLKAAIRKELKELGYRFSDGSYEKYGAGATSVSLAG